MSEKKGNYVVVSEYSHFCLIENAFESEAIEIAKIIEKLEKDNHAKIFKIEKEIDWKGNTEEKDSKENTEKGQNDSFSRYDIFD